MELLVALVAKDRDYRLKRLMADQFENMEGQLAAINGPDGSTIITGTNKKGAQVLREQIARGKKGWRSSTVRAISRIWPNGWKATLASRDLRQRWLVAWDIPAQEAEEKPSEGAEQSESTTATEEATVDSQ